jgi:hypothetical protein
MITKVGSPPKPRVSCRATVAEQIVDEHGAMRNEAVVPHSNELADERVGLNPAALADGCPLLYLDEGPDKTVISNRAAIEIDRLNDGDVFAELHIDNAD